MMKENLNKLIQFLFFVIIFLIFFFLIINFFNLFIVLKIRLILFLNNYFIEQGFEFLNCFVLIFKYFYIYKLSIFDNFVNMLYGLFLYFFKFFYINILKIKIFLKTFIYKFLLKKQLLIKKFFFKYKGYNEFFAAFFFSPTLYRFFSFYIFFIAFFIALDWIEHFFESIDNSDAEFEIDFEESFSWENDPLIGKNFFFLGQRLSSEKTSEGPDLYKANDFFYQSKKSNFNIYNREFLGGPEYLNLLDFFSVHENFHQVGTYEFFSPSFIVIYVSYEFDFEFDFFFIQKFFFFFNFFFSRNFRYFLERNFLFFFYWCSFLLLLIKYVYICIKNIIIKLIVWISKF